MTMRRCSACGGFFDAEECPNDHSHIEGYTPPVPEPAPYIELRGRVVIAKWPSTGDPVLGVITDAEDEDGNVGFAVLTPNIRVPLHDLERID
jgi:hypothetical protein